MTSTDCFGYARWSLTACQRCGYEKAECACIGGFASLEAMDAEILRQRFQHDICLDCGRDESGHEVERDRWGDVVVRCVHRDYQPAV